MIATAVPIINIVVSPKILDIFPLDIRYWNMTSHNIPNPNLAPA
jgi:hypothetical protein